MTPFPLVLLWVRFPTLDSTESCLCVPWPAFLGLLCVLLQKALALCVSAAFKSLFPSLTRSHTPGKVEVLKLIQGTFSSTSCSVLSFFFFFSNELLSNGGWLSKSIPLPLWRETGVVLWSPSDKGQPGALGRELKARQTEICLLLVLSQSRRQERCRSMWWRAWPLPL